MIKEGYKITDWGNVRLQQDNFEIVFLYKNRLDLSHILLQVAQMFQYFLCYISSVQFELG